MENMRALALLLATCSACAPQAPATSPDLGPPPDLAEPLAAPPDLLSLPDLTPPDGPLPPTGGACHRTTDCASGLGPNQKGSCTLATGTGASTLAWPGGSCTSACRTSNKGGGATNSDCPADPDSIGAVCIAPPGQSIGTCRAACADHLTDCRDGYVCGFVGGSLGSCLPAGASGCDATKPCGDASTVCVSYSPDDSYGLCETACDLFAQDCAPLMNQPRGCLPNAQGKGACIAIVGVGAVEGAACIFENDCAAGLTCHQGACRPFCGGPGAVACTNGKACVDLSPQVPQAVVGVCGG
jgi:hypothetical protein